MPAIVGSMRVISVSSASIVHIGDSIQLAPQSTSKTFAGAGSFNTGDYMQTNNSINATNTYDLDVADNNIIPINGAGGV